MGKQKEENERLRQLSEFAQTASERDFLIRLEAMQSQQNELRAQAIECLNQCGEISMDVFFITMQRQTVLLHKEISEKESATT